MPSPQFTNITVAELAHIIWHNREKRAFSGAGERRINGLAGELAKHPEVAGKTALSGNVWSKPAETGSYPE